MGITRTLRRTEWALPSIVALTAVIALSPAGTAIAQNWGLPPPPDAERATAVPRAQGWRVSPTVAVDLTLTNNVNLDPAATARSDFVTQISPGVQISGRSARAELAGSISVPIVLYARTGSENNQVVPQVNLLGRLEAIEKFFFVEAAALVSQQYFTPFGARPDNVVNNTDNQYISGSYRVTPFITGKIGSDVTYLVRDDNIWSTVSGAPVSVENSYVNNLVATLAREPSPLGWALDYNRNDTTFSGQSGQQLQQLVRARPIWQPEPQLRLSVSGGYEDNDFPFSAYRGAIYGVGGRWRPSERTTLDGFWEHRFFGASYGVVFDHRTPLTAWNLNVGRNITSYTLQAGQLPAGGNVSLLLSEILSSRIPDPIERQRAVQQFIQQNGLPNVLSGPVNLYTQQVYLQEQARLSVGLSGVRNSVFLFAFWLRTLPISGAGQLLPPELAQQNNNTQSGGGATWSHRLTPMTTLNLSADYLRTVANAPLVGTTEQGTLRAVFNTPISPNSSLLAGARYQLLSSDVTDGYHEAAVFVGIAHTFR